VFVYSIWGPQSTKGGILAWCSECVTLLAQALATTEILKVTLRPYQGIWGLAWRALAFTSALVILIVALATHGVWAVATWFELNRGYHLTFAAAVIACLLLVRYYSIPVPAAYKMSLSGNPRPRSPLSWSNSFGWPPFGSPCPSRSGKPPRPRILFISGFRQRSMSVCAS
jgi:hypothetical protein